MFTIIVIISVAIIINAAYAYVKVLLKEKMAKLEPEKKVDQLSDESDSMRRNYESEYHRQKMNEDINSLKEILSTKPIVLSVYTGIVIVLMLCSSIYTTNEQQTGFSTMFGQDTLIENAGIHTKVPFLSSTHIYDATTQGMPIGYYEDTDESAEEDSLMITSDFNFLNIDFYLEYRISDPIAYYYCTDNPEEILRNITLASVRNTVGLYDVDSAMTTGKTEIETVVLTDLNEELARHSTGLSIVNISIQDSEAPTDDVKTAFKLVEDAKQNADTALNDANKYVNTTIPAAEADAEQIRQEATASQTERINQAKEEIATFEALYSEYAQNPDVVKQRMYWETISKIMPNMEIVIGKDSKVVYVIGDSTNTSVTTNN